MHAKEVLTCVKLGIQVNYQHFFCAVSKFPCEVHGKRGFTYTSFPIDYCHFRNHISHLSDECVVIYIILLDLSRGFKQGHGNLLRRIASRSPSHPMPSWARISSVDIGLAVGV